MFCSQLDRPSDRVRLLALLAGIILADEDLLLGEETLFGAVALLLSIVLRPVAPMSFFLAFSEPLFRLNLDLNR